jgi:hypothetical protein
MFASAVLAQRSWAIEGGNQDMASLRSLQIGFRCGIAKRSQHSHHVTFVVERVRYDVQNNKSRGSLILPPIARVVGSIAYLLHIAQSDQVMLRRALHSSLVRKKSSKVGAIFFTPVLPRLVQEIQHPGLLDLQNVHKLLPYRRDAEAWQAEPQPPDRNRRDLLQQDVQGLMQPCVKISYSVLCEHVTSQLLSRKSRLLEYSLWCKVYRDDFVPGP